MTTKIKPAKSADKKLDSFRAQIGSPEKAEFYCDEILQLTAPGADQVNHKGTKTLSGGKSDGKKTPALDEAQIALEAAATTWRESCSDTATVELIDDAMDAIKDAKTERDELLAAVENMLEMFEESHAEEIRTNHHGDGAKDCSYCAAIKQMRAAIVRARG